MTPAEKRYLPVRIELSTALSAEVSALADEMVLGRGAVVRLALAELRRAIRDGRYDKKRGEMLEGLT